MITEHSENATRSRSGAPDSRNSAGESRTAAAGSYYAGTETSSSILDAPDHTDFFNDESGHDSPETSLWRAVVTQAMMDALSRSAKRLDRLERARAASWLSGTSRDFHMVCGLAEYSATRVRARAQAALRRQRENDQPAKRKKTTKLEMRVSAASAVLPKASCL